VLETSGWVNPGSGSGARVDSPGPLEDRSRAPHSHPSRLEPVVVEALVQARRAHAHWGARKILAWLARKQPELRLPAASTVSDVFARYGLSRARHARRRTPPYTDPSGEADAANRIWCADFKGDFKTGDHKRCYPLTVTDAFSRMLLRCTALKSTKTIRVQPVFESVFREFGLPEPAGGTLAVSGTFAPVSVNGEVTVTEQREEIECSDTDDDTAVVYQPLAVSLSMDSSDLMCPVAPASALALLYGDVAVDVVVKGGSGNWSLDYVLAGDTDVYGGNISGVLACVDAASLLDADADYADTCAFSLSDGKACALGQISLGVTDVGNAACTFPAQGPLQAEKTTELDVAPLAP